MDWKHWLRWLKHPKQKLLLALSSKLLLVSTPYWLIKTANKKPNGCLITMARATKLQKELRPNNFWQKANTHSMYLANTLHLRMARLLQEMAATNKRRFTSLAHLQSMKLRENRKFNLCLNHSLHKYSSKLRLSLGLHLTAL